jgi:1-acyl-sn-glycerol-3-phosphate acyltransferase
MSFDGFEATQSDAFTGFDATTATRVFETIDRVARALRLEVVGLEHLPPGPALLVANHAFGWDAAFLMAAVWRTKQRPLWALGEHLWWRVPFLRGVAAACGTVDGTQDNVDRLLERGQLVLVLPGGLREAVKPATLRYRLLWGRRFGFVRAAIRHGVPVVPVASVGTDELFDFVGDAYERGRRWTGGRLSIPIPLPRRILPLPHLSALRFVVGSPITPPAAADGPDEQQVLERFRREIAGALHELIDNELARRAGIELGG